ncbi:hypothetical protein RR47_GL002008 [Enterococcus columbae DSM 7374 = ATCC 51263]|nr:hypothetical protein RR47_GL002008 [Enterococcus columbae DSM 7374 = ATCC 51263]
MTIGKWLKASKRTVTVFLPFLTTANFPSSSITLAPQHLQGEG